MASVFAKLKQRTDEYAGKRSPDQLVPGQPYPCYKFTQRKSDFADKKTGENPMTLVAYVKDVATSNKYYLTLPALYNDITSEDVTELNKAIADKKPPFVVYYGKDGKRNDLQLHEFGESVDNEKLTRYLKNEDDPSPSKRAKLDNDLTASTSKEN